MRTFSAGFSMLCKDETVMDDLKTVRDWIRWGATEFQKSELYYGHGTDNPWDEAAQLVLWVLHTPWEKLEHIVQANITSAEKKAILEAFDRRIRLREPAPYITGIAYFAGLSFSVNTDTLIPRSPIAELIQNGFQPWLVEPPARVLDLCTGSGCIGIACAYAFPDSQVDLSDISSSAISVAQDNISQHHLEDRVTAIQSDLFENIHGQYDLIVSNPPYVDAQDMASLPSEYRVEPELALASGEDGLNFTRLLLNQAKTHLTDTGVLIVEVGNSAVALQETYKEVPFLWLEFESGGEGVFMLTKEQLIEYADIFAHHASGFGA